MLLREQVNTHLHAKSKIPKYLNSEEYSKSKVTNQMTKSKAQTHQTNKDNCHIPELVQAFSYAENGGLNLILYNS